MTSPESESWNQESLLAETNHCQVTSFTMILLHGLAAWVSEKLFLLLFHLYTWLWMTSTGPMGNWEHMTTHQTLANLYLYSVKIECNETKSCRMTCTGRTTAQVHGSTPCRDTLKQITEANVTSLKFQVQILTVKELSGHLCYTRYWQQITRWGGEHGSISWVRRSE